MATYNVKIRICVREGYSDFRYMNVLVESVDEPEVHVLKVKEAKIQYADDAYKKPRFLGDVIEVYEIKETKK